MNIREKLEERELAILSPFAVISRNTKGRNNPDDKCTIRTDFQVDRDRIIHSKAFRRLKQKTQVFISPKSDHYRTRLTHTLEVSQIARTISRALCLNEDLTEAIALGHDLGHTPFGHAGEKALNEVSLCGFKHFEQSLRVVDKLEKSGKGLNLTYEVRDGILNHTRGNQPETLEGQVVRISDRIAYLNHDIEDAKRAGVLKKEDIPPHILETLGQKKTKRIDKLIKSLVKNSSGGILRMETKVQSVFDDLHVFMYTYVYENQRPNQEEVPVFIETMYNYFMKNTEKLPQSILEIANEDGLDRAICDYIAGMTDLFALRTFKNIFVPKTWSI